MNAVGYIKSFSKGQITIPKVVREALGIGDDFWLKLYVDNGKIVAEPVEKDKNQSDYLKRLLSIKGWWMSEDEIKKNRTAVEKQLKERAL